MNNLVAISRKLAYLLRHTQHINPKGGWMDAHVAMSTLSISRDTLEQIVSLDSKGRYQLSEDGAYIRALYGHSVDVELSLEPSTPPATLYHGTAQKSVESIMICGILPRSRNYVHLSQSMDSALQVGQRHGTPTILTIDSEAMTADGHHFYQAQANIWLTECVPPQYIKPSGE